MGNNLMTLEYGQSTASGAFACTSESTGMTCWHATTGHGGLFIGVFWLSPANTLPEGDVRAACPI